MFTVSRAVTLYFFHHDTSCNYRRLPMPNVLQFFSHPWHCNPMQYEILRIPRNLCTLLYINVDVYIVPNMRVMNCKNNLLYVTVSRARTLYFFHHEISCNLLICGAYKCQSHSQNVHNKKKLDPADSLQQIDWTEFHQFQNI